MSEIIILRTFLDALMSVMTASEKWQYASPGKSGSAHSIAASKCSLCAQMTTVCVSVLRVP